MCGRRMHDHHWAQADPDSRRGHQNNYDRQYEQERDEAAREAMTSTNERIGDAERERAVSDLGDHFAAGRLTRDELDERLDKAWDAKTAADLRPLFTDLPGEVVVQPVDRRTGAGSSRLTGPSWSHGPSGPHRGSGFPLPLLLILAIVLTIVTHVPFILFFVAWFVLSRIVGGRHHRHYAIRP